MNKHIYNSIGHPTSYVQEGQMETDKQNETILYKSDEQLKNIDP